MLKCLLTLLYLLVAMLTYVLIDLYKLDVR